MSLVGIENAECSVMSVNLTTKMRSKNTSDSLWNYIILHLNKCKAQRANLLEMELAGSQLAGTGLQTS